MAETDVKPRTPYKRVITEKRRQQNRESQKKYRQRIKKRLEELEGQFTSKQDQVDELHPKQPLLKQAVETPSEHCFHIDREAYDDIDLNAAFEAAGDLPVPGGINLGFATFHIPWRPRESPLVSYLDTSTHNQSNQSSPVCDASTLMIQPDPSSPDLRLFWPISPDVRIKDYSLQPHLFTPKTSFASLSSSSSAPTFDGTSSSAASPFGSLPDPYRNIIRLQGEACLNATFSVATVLGISQSAYINDHPSLFYHSIEPNFYHLPRYLRPTPNQLRLPHPVYLDCIVFPTFRSRAIALSAKGQLDHCALFLDLLQDGLVCWGNADANCHVGKDMRDGVAWSPTSWEARPWFLRRWGFLVGKEDEDAVDVDEPRDDDGIWQQSRWWWVLRGEDED